MIRLDDPVQALDVVEAIADGGITTVEITLTTPEAPALIARLCERSDLLVGAGTVLDIAAARTVFEAGALFYASPILDPALIRFAHQRQRMAMPGAYSPTEIMAAWREGADIIKVFPMPAEGAAFLAALRGPLPSIRIAPSGGVTALSAPHLMAAGAVALNVGSWLTHEADGTLSSLEKIRSRASQLTAAVHG